MSKQLFHILSLITLLWCSCDNNSHTQQLINQAEAIIDSNHDSAYQILQGINSANLPPKEFAKFTILSAQALDKRHDTINLTMPLQYAIKYYTTKNDNFNLMKALYYRGRSLTQKDSTTQALLCFYGAETHTHQLNEPFWEGLICRNISDIYYDSFNSNEAVLLAKRSLECMKRAKKSTYIHYAQLDLAKTLNMINEFDSTILICKQLLDSAAVYDDSYLKYSSNNLIGLTLLSQKKFKEAIIPLQVAANSEYTTSEDSAYLAYAYVGDLRTQEGAKILKEISNPSSDPIFNLLKYQIYKNLGQYDSALNHMEIIYRLDDLNIRKKANGNYITTLSDYASKLDQLEKEKHQVATRTYILIICCLLFLFLSIILIFISVYNRKRLQIEEKVLIAQQLTNDLNNTISASNHTAALSKVMRESKFEFLEEMCMILMQHGTNDKAKLKIANTVTSFIEEYSTEGSKTKSLEKLVNSIFHNILSDFRADLPNLKEQDYRLFLFSILQFSNNAITILLKEKDVRAVYERRRRLKNKINNLEASKATQYISYLR